MDRARIRWRNVGRIAGGLGAAGLLVVVVPGLLEPPEPPPLPDDVGLATGATRPVRLRARRASPAPATGGLERR